MFFSLVEEEVKDHLEKAKSDNVVNEVVCIVSYIHVKWKIRHYALVIMILLPHVKTMAYS